ncbi:hypothetical protein WN944_025810 [Citrus x changshan-huyou]|uniref:Uncharacterized protein n=1 Tax=Citrus x changshan-huyou TaxID=2935761 RepID=A0AAP0LQI0_9ROSI
MNVGKPGIWLTLGGDNPLTVSLSSLPSESNDLQQNWKGVELFYIDMNMMTPFVTATKDDDHIHTAGNGILNQQHGWRVACENALTPKLIDIAQ